MAETILYFYVHNSMKTDNIIIVGGGSSGWMSAATLLSQFPNKKITLIESPNIATVGVGESTVGGISSWLELLGIKDEDFLVHTDATYKLSIEFEDFYRKGAGKFHYPFGVPYTEGNTASLNDWHMKKMVYPETPVYNYAECFFPQMALVTQNKLFKNEDNRLPGFNFLRDTAYQFDATKFGLWLRDNYCLPRGLNHVLAEVKDVTQNENGIEHLILDDGSLWGADLFLDCTGFRSLLLNQTLNAPFISYTDILPNDSAWATHIPYQDKNSELVTYTKCTAIDHGWVWNIPLWSRIGSGFVYSGEFITDEDALKEFQEHIGKGDELDYKNIKMRIGIHDRLWVKNVVAIGLSGGFIEPLESNGLKLTHDSLFNLTRVLQRETANQWDRDVFNAITKADFREFAEFVSMHYALSHRDDTEYWRTITDRVVSPELITQMAGPYVTGFVCAVHNVCRINHHHIDGGIHCIGTGMNWWPTDKPSIIYGLCDGSYDFEENFKSSIEQLDNKTVLWNALVEDCPTHYQYLKENFYDKV